MKRIVSLITCCFLLLIPALTSAQKFEYPSNQDKSFLSEDDFYQSLNKDMYKEFEDATYSVRRKISYKEVPDSIMSFEKKTGRYFGQPLDELASHIHPNRQVYFFASFVQTKNKEYWKHIVIDAETKMSFESGHSEHTYDNPYN